MSTDTPAPRKSTNKVTPRKPRATLDLRKYFHSYEDGTPIITCGYCEDDIPANPKKGMNLRRRAHLERCQDFKTHVDYKAFVLKYDSIKWIQWKGSMKTNDNTSEDEEDTDRYEKISHMEAQEIIESHEFQYHGDTRLSAEYTSIVTIIQFILSL